MFRQKDREKCSELYEKYYASRKFFDSLYREAIRRHLKPGQRLLDAGCGRYLTFSKELADIAHVVGIDLDSVLETDNRKEPFGIRGDLGRLPFPSGYFDMIISRSVVEHLDDPLTVFREFSRVLRQGGKVVIVTPNKYDYVSLVAAITPYSLHRSFVSRIFPVSEHDVFPTRYRANTLFKLKKTMRTAGFSATELDTVNHYPAYLMFSPTLFRLGVLYERMTSMGAFRSLRGSLLCVFEKFPATATPAAKHVNTPVEVS